MQEIEQLKRDDEIAKGGHENTAQTPWRGKVGHFHIINSQLCRN